jgi:flagellar basal-body rod modification protein FlgD
MAITQDVTSLLQPYSVSANVTDNGVDVASSTISGGSAKKSDKVMGKDDFLLLLVTQLRYQDPLNPMDNTQFVTQLAQFQSLEGTNNIEKAISALNDSFKGSVDAQKKSADSLTNAAAISLIGKTVRMKVSEFDWNASSGATIGIPVYLGSADQTTVQIKDANGKTVRTLSASGKDGNNIVLCTWDGKNDNGETAPTGSYTVALPDEKSGVYAFVDGSVDGVSNLSDGVKVRIGGVNFDLSDIVYIADKTSKS